MRHDEEDPLEGIEMFDIKMIISLCSQHDFIVDKDGQVTCAICGCMDDEMPQIQDPYKGIANVKLYPYEFS